MSPEGLRSEKECAGEARRKLKTTNLTSRQRGHPTSTKTLNCPKIIKEKREICSRVPDGCLTQRQTDRLTVGRNITLVTYGFPKVSTIVKTLKHVSKSTMLDTVHYLKLLTHFNK
jgi:hypothetical protein